MTRLVAGWCMTKGCRAMQDVQRHQGNENGVHVFAVADGMANRYGGAEAARLACEAVVGLSRLDEMDLRFGLAQAVVRKRMDALVEAAIKHLTREEARRKYKMGTTLAAIAIDRRSGKACFAHLGNTRIYILRKGLLIPLTRDHTIEAQMIVADSQQAKSEPGRKIRYLTHFIGMGRYTPLECTYIDELHAGDRFLLCTDGVHGALDDRLIQRILVSTANPRTAARRLIKLVLRARPHTADNATAVVIDIAS